MMQEPQQQNSPEPGVATATERQSLGEPIRAFRASPGMRIGAAVLGVVFVIIAIWWFVQDMPFSFHLWVLAALAFGIAFLAGKESHLVCPGGVIIQERNGREQHCRWEEVSEIVDSRIKMSTSANLSWLGFFYTGQGVPKEEVPPRQCVLVKKDGSRMELVDRLRGDFEELVALLREQAQSRGIPWKEEERRV
jgi:hypothetical protein